jgi:hypothetical protein
MQTRKRSMIESIVNVLIGYLVAVGSQIVIFPIFGVETSIADNFLMAIWFTVISIIRSYSIRRLFNGWKP